jgi:cyclase
MVFQPNSTVKLQNNGQAKSIHRPRVIPILLLKGNGLVKSVKFDDYKYIGDPINAVKIFNDLKADELVFLDIMASKEKRTISLDFVHKVGDEANMPFAVGGGINSLQQIKELNNAGAEKAIINTMAAERPEFIKEAADAFGSSTITVSIDVKKKFLGKQQVYILGGSKATGIDPVEFAQQMESFGAGEIIINSIERDGTMEGYDLELIKKISEAVSIPVVAVGGAGNLLHLKQAVVDAYASAVGVGSMFVFHGPRKAVLVNYPKNEELLNLFN